MVQVGEYLSSKPEALSSNLSTIKKEIIIKNKLVVTSTLMSLMVPIEAKVLPSCHLIFQSLNAGCPVETV
jgi:hypothetical protein